MTTRADRTESRANNTEETGRINQNPSGVAGETVIADEVVAAIAGHAAAEVDGVVKLGTGNVLRSLTDAMGSDANNKGRGISVEAGTLEAVFDIELTVEYGRPIPDVVRKVRESIARDIRSLAGMETREINVDIIAIEFPERIKSRVR
ncbi:MAG: Asp23/Gls24 family envelope stress response protein [Dehalococcoidia bacterium]